MAAPPPPENPRNLTVVSKTENSIRVSWDASTTSGITSYRVYWKVSGADDSTRNFKTAVSPTNITGLNPATNYEIRATALSRDGESSGITLTVATDVPDITNLTFIVGATAVVVNWRQPGAGYTYDFRYRKGTEDYSDWATTQLLTQQEITTLESSTVYGFEIRTRKGSLISDPAVTGRFTTSGISGPLDETVLPIVDYSRVYADVIDVNGNVLSNGPLDVNDLQIAYLTSSAGSWGCTIFAGNKDANLLRFPNQVRFKEAGSDKFLGIGVVEEVVITPKDTGETLLRVSGSDQIILLKNYQVPANTLDNVSSLSTALAALQAVTGNSWTFRTALNPNLIAFSITIDKYVNLLEALNTLAEYSSTGFYLSDDKTLQFVNYSPILTTIVPKYTIDFSADGLDPTRFKIEPGISITEDARGVATRVVPTDGNGRDASDNNFSANLLSGQSIVNGGTTLVDNDAELLYGVRTAIRNYPDAKPASDSADERRKAANTLMRLAQIYLLENNRPKRTYVVSINISIRQRIPPLLGRRLIMNLNPIKDKLGFPADEDVSAILLYVKEANLSVAQDHTVATRRYDLTLTDGRLPTLTDSQEDIAQKILLNKQSRISGQDVEDLLEDQVGEQGITFLKGKGRATVTVSNDGNILIRNIGSGTTSLTITAWNLLHAIDRALLGNTNWRGQLTKHNLLSESFIIRGVDSRRGGRQTGIIEISATDIIRILDSSLGSTDWRS